MEHISDLWIWIGFLLFIVLALIIDALVIKRKQAGKRPSIREAIFWTCNWIALAIIFNGCLWFYLYSTANLMVANEKALAFFTGYLIEKSLSIDNLFVFYLLFNQLKIPVHAQQRVFTYGIWSAVVMRFMMILFFAWLIQHFHSLLYLMGAFLLFTGIKMLFTHPDNKPVTKSKLFEWIKTRFRITTHLHGERFYIYKNHLLYVTPLLIALIFIEVSDLIFALDSIPAIFAITTDPFIIWSSNIFALLGLRALYFVLIGLTHQFALLKYGLALIILFVGTKMLIEPWLSISVGISLAVIAGILLSFTLASLVRRS